MYLTAGYDTDVHVTFERGGGSDSEDEFPYKLRVWDDVIDSREGYAWLSRDEAIRLAQGILRDVGAAGWTNDNSANASETRIRALAREEARNVVTETLATVNVSLQVPEH